MKLYLTTYNIVSAILWSVIFINNLRDIISIIDPTWISSIYTDKSIRSNTEIPHAFLVYVQLFNTVVELSNSVLGITKSPIAITALQFFARDVITIGVCLFVPKSPGNYNQWAFPGLTLAWSIVELIRYPYYAFKAMNISPPYWLHWLRYSAFLVLYPMGLITEPIVIYQSLNYIDHWFHYYFFAFGLSLYIPGIYMLYGYMLKQRSKVLA